MGALEKESETGEIPTVHQEGLDSPGWEMSQKYWRWEWGTGPEGRAWRKVGLPMGHVFWRLREHKGVS